MAQEHVDIADGERHEPKGADAATLGEVWSSDGAQSGSHKQPTVALNVEIPDISTAASVWVVAPLAGVIEAVYTVIDTAITTGDAIITLELSGTLVTGSSITIANAASAAGDVDSASPSALNVVAAGGAIEVITDGGSTVASKANVTLLIRGT